MNGIFCANGIENFPVGDMGGGHIGRNTYERREVSNKRTCGYERGGDQSYAIVVRTY